MKNYVMAVLFVLFGAALVSAGCGGQSTKPDPDHGVSNSSYRDVVGRGEANVAQLEARWADLEAADKAHAAKLSAEHPEQAPEHFRLRPDSWWEVEGNLLHETKHLFHDTLQGSDAGTAPVASGGAK